ncbi:hypothetical protein Calkr_2353 [Caldicellulosiruptor acetigenus I77R1B]|uniref:Uncharacterized protein n=1 Tax=Caldicellulosiruptor acetigenus (strain ATCC 700853 / DSM 12137 / I77R1B) TaxID=632335 RepID=E4S7B3_CALA7|nr:hypothetical protein [Caldicellulosiruptor acetigenus]ADQ41796.1 hypothetical protein Calkr_2353 [Caldicellulosiruptor acetigenus I77R1B]
MKTPKEVLYETIKDDLIIYLKSGKLSLFTFLNKLNLNIHRIEELLKVHFLLKSEVRDFVLNLPSMLRKLKVSTILSEETNHVQIKGQINWQKTLMKRLNQNYKDSTLLCYNQTSKLYSTKENLVLKEFVKVLYETIFMDIGMERFTKYEWYERGEEINKVVKELYEKNSYLSKIDLQHAKITDRMIEMVSKHRNSLYNQAAKLLREYRRIVRLDLEEKEIKNLFEKTFIEVADENTLFELYWVIRILRDNASNEMLFVVDGRNNKVAMWEDEMFENHLYHNVSNLKDIMFRVGFEEVENVDNEYFKRYTNARKMAKQLAFYLFGNKNTSDDSFWSGRPDILVEIRNKSNGELVKLVIGEVKYTTDRDYMMEGLYQLLEYIYFVRQNGGYLFNNQKNRVELQGILFVDNIEFTPLEKNYWIKIYTPHSSKITL